MCKITLRNTGRYITFIDHDKYCRPSPPLCVLSYNTRGANVEIWNNSEIILEISGTIIQVCKILKRPNIKNCKNWKKLYSLWYKIGIVNNGKKW